MNGKLIAAALCSLAAGTVAVIVILDKKYAADDKKSAWAIVSSIVTFWLGVGAAK